MTTLAETLVRWLPPALGFRAAGEDLARRISRCADNLPPGVHLILGGSLARGEPSIMVRGSEYELISEGFSS
ncbi:hypothetical protein AB0B83_29590 [Micromonospora sp. NPDC049060]|uniref:hypothetical protein n=1 Tax=Micromonospora sp. NPDC049060 TaxID=3154828 RepID=UPI0033E77D29